MFPLTEYVSRALYAIGLLEDADNFYTSLIDDIKPVLVKAWATGADVLVWTPLTLRGHSWTQLGHPARHGCLQCTSPQLDARVLLLGRRFVAGSPLTSMGFHDCSFHFHAPLQTHQHGNGYVHGPGSGAPLIGAAA